MSNSTSRSNDPQGSSAGPSSPPQLVVHAGPTPLTISIADCTESVLAQLDEQLRQRDDVRIDISSLSGWPDAQRPMIVRLLARHPRVTLIVGHKTFTDRFRAVLAAMVDADDLAAHGRSLRAAIEAAEIFQPGLSHVTAAMVIERLRELGVAPPNQAMLARQIRDLGMEGIGGPGVDRPDAYRLAMDFYGFLHGDSSASCECPQLVNHRSDFYQFTGQIHKRMPDDYLRARVTTFLQQQQVPDITTTLVRDVLTNLEGLAIAPPCDVDLPFYIESVNPVNVSRRHCIACQNGVVDLDLVATEPQSALRPADGRWVSTVLLSFDYDPDESCPTWERFLSQTLPPADCQDRRLRVIQEMLGYLLLGDTRFEKLFFLYGPARTGKSTLLKVAEAMLGEENVSHVPFDQLGQEFRLVTLRGKLANFSAEVDHLGRAREALLKQLVSGERINANRKHKEPIEILPTAKLVFAANDLPNIVDTSEGVWRRLIVIPFDQVVPEDQVNTTLFEELKAELPGIFNWAVVGLARLLEQQRFTFCRRCQQAAQEHRATCDSVREFFDECVGRNVNFDAHSQRLYEVYSFFSEKRGRKPVMANEFGKRLHRLAVTNRRARPTEDVDRPHLYRGIVLNGVGRQWMDRYLHVEAGRGWTDLAYEVFEDSSSPPFPEEDSNHADAIGFGEE